MRKARRYISSFEKTTDQMRTDNGAIDAGFSDVVVERGQLPGESVDWRAELKTRRAEAIEALSKIT